MDYFMGLEKWAVPGMMQNILKLTSWKHSLQHLLGIYAKLWPSQKEYGSVSKPCTPGEHQNSW